MNAPKVSIPMLELDAKWEMLPSVEQIVSTFTEAVRQKQHVLEKGNLRVFGLPLAWHLDGTTVSRIEELLADKLSEQRLKARLEEFSYSEDDVCGGSRIEAIIAI